MANKYEDRPEDIQAAKEAYEWLKKKGWSGTIPATPAPCPFCFEDYIKATRESRGGLIYFHHGTYICKGEKE